MNLKNSLKFTEVRIIEQRTKNPRTHDRQQTESPPRFTCYFTKSCTQESPHVLLNKPQAAMTVTHICKSYLK